MHIQLLSEEILLEILSYLSIQQLLTSSRISKKFNRLSEEPLLWRKIYFDLFKLERLKPPFWPALNQRLRQEESSSSLDSTKGKKTDSADLVGHTWKTLCRVSLNWKTGSAGLTRIKTPITPTTTKSPTSISTSYEEINPLESHPIRSSNTIVRFYRSLLFITCKSTLKNSTEPHLPLVHVYHLQNHPQAPPQSFLIGTLLPTHDSDSFIGLGVSEISIDQSSSSESASSSKSSKDSPILLAVFYTDARFVVFKVSSSSRESLDFHQLACYQSPNLNKKKNQIHVSVETAKFYYPILVTCSVDFLIQFFLLDSTTKASEEGQLVEVYKLSLDMQNPTCYWPLSMDLRRSTNGDEEEEEKFKLKIAYPMPFYPSAWTLGLQELEFKIISSLHRQPGTPPHYVQILTNRLVTALHYNSTTNTTKQQQQQQGGSGGRSRSEIGLGGVIVRIEQSGSNLIVGRSDNTIDMFSCVNSQDSTTTTNMSSKEEKEGNMKKGYHLVCNKRMYGHSSRISSICIDDTGRCVSAALDGIKIWDTNTSNHINNHNNPSPSFDDVDVDEPISITIPKHFDNQMGTTTGSHSLIKSLFPPNYYVAWIGFDHEKIVSLCILTPPSTTTTPSEMTPSEMDKLDTPFHHFFDHPSESCNSNEEVRVFSFF